MRKPQEVIDAITAAMCSMGNAGRGVNEASLGAARTVYDTREKLAAFFGAEDARQIVFTMNSTESLNIAIKGILNPGDHVISTVLEHQFTKPMSVVVDGNSASASEIFAGAIQDYGLGPIVGTTTYGKGIVQQIFDLGDGTCVKLTMAEYYTPNGRNIHKKGITPDVEVEYQQDENNPDADNQLDAALEQVRNKINQ